MVVGGFVTGRAPDQNYERTAQDIGHTINRTAGDNMNMFLIERARSRGGWRLLVSFMAALVG